MAIDGFHRNCVKTLKKTQAELGVDVDVFAKAPKPPSLHLKEWRCSHGVRYFYQPSRMQVERWKYFGTQKRRTPIR